MNDARPTPPPARPHEPATSGAGAPGAPTTGRASYSERLVPGVGGWLAVVGFAALVFVMLVVVSPTAAGIAGGGALALLLAAAWFTSPVVAVADGELRAGRARIPVDLLGEPVVLGRAEVRTAMGPGYDPRSYTCLRTWTGGALWLDVLDPADPTPGWLVSTRRPEALRAAIDAARTPAGR